MLLFNDVWSIFVSILFIYISIRFFVYLIRRKDSSILLDKILPIIDWTYRLFPQPKVNRSMSSNFAVLVLAIGFLYLGIVVGYPVLYR